ncbi:MAG: sugar ABC transporter permease [Caldilineaceae bacterium]|nr:sugar ABC transporter permease [Caldilineaceae bacterium]
MFSQQNLSTRRILLAWLLVTPVVLWRLLTSVYPFLRTFYISFFDNSPVRRTFDFVGLDNYIALTRDSNVDATLTFTLFFTVTSVILQVVFGLAIAELLNQRFRMRNLTRAVNLLPWAMAPIVIATAARWIFHQDYGLINDIIWRLSGERPLWLVNFTTARFAVTITDVWKNTAFLSVIFLSGLQGIPLELYEAAKIDGADGVRSYWYVTLPLLMPLIISMIIFTAIFRVLSFEIVYALTNGGPGTATSLLSYLVYLEGFRVLNFGYASAIAMLLFFIVLLVGVLGYGFLRRAWERL